jgi:hypothetical protein
MQRHNAHTLYSVVKYHLQQFPNSVWKCGFQEKKLRRKAQVKEQRTSYTDVRSGHKVQGLETEVGKEKQIGDNIVEHLQQSHTGQQLISNLLAAILK